MCGARREKDKIMHHDNFDIMEAHQSDKTCKSKFMSIFKVIQSWNI